MKHILMISLLLVAQGALAGLLVTDISGKAEIEGRGPVATLAEIPDGARLTLASGAQLVVVDLSSGREYMLKGEGSYIAAAGGPRAANGKPVEAIPLPVKNLPEVKVATAKVAHATLVMRSMRKFNVPVLNAPARTTVITETPVFLWSGVDGAASYRLVLKDQNGVVWETTATETELVVPSGRSLRAGERYIWRIEAIGADGRTISDAAASFAVAPGDTIKRLSELKPAADAPFGRRVLYAAQLREAGALADARELWKILAQERPDDEVLKSLAE